MLAELLNVQRAGDWDLSHIFAYRVTMEFQDHIVYDILHVPDYLNERFSEAISQHDWDDQDRPWIDVSLDTDRMFYILCDMDFHMEWSDELTYWLDYTTTSHSGGILKFDIEQLAAEDLQLTTTDKTFLLYIPQSAMDGAVCMEDSTIFSLFRINLGGEAQPNMVIDLRVGGESVSSFEAYVGRNDYDGMYCLVRPEIHSFSGNTCLTLITIMNESSYNQALRYINQTLGVQLVETIVSCGIIGLYDKCMRYRCDFESGKKNVLLKDEGSKFKIKPGLKIMVRFPNAEKIDECFAESVWIDEKPKDRKFFIGQDAVTTFANSSGTATSSTGWYIVDQQTDIVEAITITNDDEEEPELPF